ncbi:phosphopyruvate hydratase [Candidatus Fonsibacter ubiquis]|uniref:phosphopyruvate hydratase n=1 Tax=Candidatus Fonsibacter ubiquis TaxID=1925548 RepID=UPI000C08D6A3|nr:phosphopyruvate hydratase [Candidatus Fonsibacter ubiquis]
MSVIKKVKARQVFDSRGFPTVEAEVILADGSVGQSIVPSGASTGSYEAHELRDKSNEYLNKGVLSAVENINSEINNTVNGLSTFEQKKIDNLLIKLDGTDNKKRLGANAILAVSIANAKAAANSDKTSLFKYLGGNNKNKLPFPMLNIINGGAHANNSLQIQEFMIRPDGGKSFYDCLRMSFLVIQNLKDELKLKKFNTNLGDEGGFAPSFNSDEIAIEYIIKAIKKAGLKISRDINICLDVAANELYVSGKYKIKENNKPVTADELINYYKGLCNKYPIVSIEDPVFEDDWNVWKKLTRELGKKVQIVGDDLFVTNLKRLKKGVKELAANAILIKPNQIGTVTETLEVINFAKMNKFNTIISHRSGDSEDTFIADLAVATESSQIKTGSLARSERVSKYNRLLRIEEEIGKKSEMVKLI